MEKCKRNPEHFVDDYGCFDCFLQRSNEILWEHLERDEMNAIKESLTSFILNQHEKTLTEAQKLSRALAEY